MDEHELRELLPEYVLGTLDPSLVAEIEHAMVRSPALREEARALAQVLYALPETLEPEPLPDGAWARLRDAAREEHRIEATGRVQRRGEVAAAEVRPRPARPPRDRSRSFRGMVAALVTALVLLVATGAWGLQASQHRARLANEERIIAYWMRDPELRIFPLQSVAAGDASGGSAPSKVRLGVVCLLPDGRAMLLQPTDAPRGTRYVLYGDDPEGKVELGATRHRFLLFDGARLTGAELTLEGRREETVGTVQF